MTVAISSLTVFALARFDAVLPTYAATAGDAVEDALLATQNANLRAAVDVISELQFIGAAASGLALLAAIWLRGGQRAPAPVASPSARSAPPAP